METKVCAACSKEVEKFLEHPDPKLPDAVLCEDCWPREEAKYTLASLKLQPVQVFCSKCKEEVLPSDYYETERTDGGVFKLVCGYCVAGIERPPAPNLYRGVTR